MRFSPGEGGDDTRSAVEKLYDDPEYRKKVATDLVRGMARGAVQIPGTMADFGNKIDPIMRLLHPQESDYAKQSMKAAEQAFPSLQSSGGDAESVGEMIGPPIGKIAKLAGLASGAAAHAPALLGMFGGKGIMSPTDRALMERMLKEGAPRHELWQQLRAWLPEWEKADPRIAGKVDNPYVHISTEGSSVAIPKGATGDFKVGDFMHAPGIEAAAPGTMAGDLKLTVDHPSVGGARYPGTGNIEVNTKVDPAFSNPEDILKHEVQHGIQEASGHVPGGNPGAMQLLLELAPEMLRKKLSDLLSASELRDFAQSRGMVSQRAVEQGMGKVFNPQAAIPGFRSVGGKPTTGTLALAQRGANTPERLGDLASDVKSRLDAISLHGTPFDAYEQLGGEMGARLGPKYWGLSDAQAKLLFPWHALDRPENKALDPRLYKDINDIGMYGP